MTSDVSAPSDTPSTRRRIAYDECRPGMEVWHVMSGFVGRRKKVPARGIGHGVIVSVDAGVRVLFDDAGADRPFEGLYDEGWFHLPDAWLEACE